MKKLKLCRIQILFHSLRFGSLLRRRSLKATSQELAGYQSKEVASQYNTTEYSIWSLEICAEAETCCLCRPRLLCCMIWHLSLSSFSMALLEEPIGGLMNSLLLANVMICSGFIVPNIMIYDLICMHTFANPPKEKIKGVSWFLVPDRVAWSEEVEAVQNPNPLSLSSLRQLA